MGNYSAFMPNRREPFYPNLVLPLLSAVLVFVFGSLLIWMQIYLSNRFLPVTEPISLRIRWADVLVGLTIYLKTSIDFALFIGRLMATYRGWRRRILIECGTAFGNILGTAVVLLIWTLFKEVRPLLALMIIVASIVLLRLAEEGVAHIVEDPASARSLTGKAAHLLDWLVRPVTTALSPILNRLVPSQAKLEKTATSSGQLLALAFSIPFILGLDDFAGYVPLFDVVRVYGFSIGVFLGHLVLTAALFVSPERTIAAVKQPLVSLFGSLAFIGLAVWGFIEAFRLLSH